MTDLSTALNDGSSVEINSESIPLPEYFVAVSGTLGASAITNPPQADPPLSVHNVNNLFAGKIEPGKKYRVYVIGVKAGVQIGSSSGLALENMTGLSANSAPHSKITIHNPAQQMFVKAIYDKIDLPTIGTSPVSLDVVVIPPTTNADED